MGALTLERISIHGFKAVDGLSMSIEPSLTLLLGVNGAGKSSVLQAFAFLRYLAAGEPLRFFEDREWDPGSLRFQSVSRRNSTVRLAAVFNSRRWGRIRWSIQWGLNSRSLLRERILRKRTPSADDAVIVDFRRSRGGRVGSQRIPPFRFAGSLLANVQGLDLDDDTAGMIDAVHGWMTRMHSLELLSPRAMKGATRLSRADMGIRGERLAGFLAGLGPDERSRVVSRISLFYPLEALDTVRRRAGWIDLVLSERYVNFGSIAAGQMSDGFMRLLALCALPELRGVSMVLLDEIEDGIEPHILGKLIPLLVQESAVQIIATSHSPLLVNVVEPSSLRLMSRTGEGRAIAARIDQMPSFHFGAEYLGAGELWTNTDASVLEAEVRKAATIENEQAEVEEP